MIPRLVHSSPVRLIDGPLIDCSREYLVNRMLADVIRCGTADNEADAMRSLRDNGYSMPDIIMCIDDVRQAAFQQTVDIVAAEISQP